jgi:hypothetical protein
MSGAQGRRAGNWLSESRPAETAGRRARQGEKGSCGTILQQENVMQQVQYSIVGLRMALALGSRSEPQPPVAKSTFQSAAYRRIDATSGIDSTPALELRQIDARLQRKGILAGQL